MRHCTRYGDTFNVAVARRCATSISAASTRPLMRGRVTPWFPHSASASTTAAAAAAVLTKGSATSDEIASSYIASSTTTRSDAASGRLRRVLEEHLANDDDVGAEMQSSAVVTRAGRASGGATGPSDSSAIAAAAKSVASSRLVIHREVAANGMEWIDVKAHPTAALDDYRNGIAAFLLDLGVHETLIESTMESVLLPQAVVADDCVTLVVRCAVEGTTHEMDSIQELTNRLTMFLFPNRVVTVHRTHMPMFATLKRQWRSHHSDVATPAYMLNHLVKECSRTYHAAIAGSVILFDKYESMLFAPQRQRATLAREIYHIKRRSSVYSRILAQTSDAFTVAIEALKLSRYDVFAQDVQQDIAHARNLADELNDNAQAVLQLLFQLSSYQLNEMMRVLTMFSAFFIPLGLIASLFGTNFENLPLIHDEYGHWYCAAFMLAVAGCLLAWFKVKRFI